MNKKFKQLLKLVLITITVFMFMAVSPKQTVSAEVADGFEFYVGNADGDKLISTEAFNTEASSFGDVELFLWARSIGTVKHIGAFQLLFEFDDQLAINSGLTALQTLTWVDGRETKTGPTYMVIPDSKNPNFFSISKNIDTAAKAKLTDYNVPLEGVKVAKFFVKIKSGTPITENNIQIKGNVPTAANSSGVQYAASSLVSTPLVVGTGMETVVSADLENVKVSGVSGTTHYDSSVGESPAINSVAISYKDAQQPLSLSITKTSASALVTQSGATAPYKTGDKITLFVTDGEGESLVSKTYELTLTVSAANSANSLSNITINKGEMSPAFNPDVSEYNISLTHAQSDLTINAYVNPADLSQLNKTTISKTFNVGTTVETFVVTAENGTQKTYTINVTREAPSSNKTITSVFVSGNEATFNGDVKYSYTLPETSTNFSFKVLLEDATSTIKYKKSTDTTYIPLTNNTSSQTISISLNQTIDIDVQVTAQDGTSVNYIVSVLRSPSTNTTLSSVKVVEGLSTNSVTPVSGVYKYTLSSSGAEEIQILTTIDPNATVKLVNASDQVMTDMIINTSSLGVGTHLYRIIVTAQDLSTTRTYNVEIVKKSDLKEITSSSVTDRDNGYQVITFNAGDYEYNSSTYTYIYRFDYKYSRIRYQLTTSLKSTITADGFKPGALANEGYFDITLSDTTQTLSINVLAEDGSVRQYTVSFVRRAADTKNKLDDLKVNGTTVDGFSPTKFNGYDRIIFPGTTTSVFVEGVLEDGSKATIKYNGVTSQQIALTRGVVKTVSILVTAENGTTNTYTLEIVAANTDNSIQNITFDNINYSFDPGVTSYTLNVPYTNTLTNVTVGTPVGANSVVTGMGAKSLAVGNNTLIVYVVSEAGVKGAEYVFNITRNQARTENILQSLTVGSYALTPSFSSTVLSYFVRVDNQITEVTVSAAVPLDNGSRIISGTGKYALTSGATKTVSILVESESGVIKTYTVDILRANDIFTFNSITIGGQIYLPTHFDGSRELHLSSLPFATKSLPVTIQKTDEFSTVNAPKLSLAGNWDLVAGENVFTFNVTSQAGTVGQTYTVYVTVNEPNTNNDLSSLAVLLGETNLLVDTQAFNASKLTYQVRVDANITELTINASVNPALNSTFTGAGVKTLSLTTQTFNIVVTAENGTQKTYIIEVTRKNDNSKIDDIVIDGFESVTYKNDQYTYNLGTTSFSTKTLSFDILLNDTRAKLYVNNQEVGRVSTYTLKSGLNTITVHAVSEFGTKGSTYTYTITQEAAKTNASLSDLDVMAGTTNLLADTFDSAVLSYVMRVDRSVAQVQIFATLKTGENQTLSGDTGNQPLSVGVNTFRVTVTAENGTTKQTYLIEVTRKNDNNEIQNITVDGKSISFDQETLTYTLEPVSFTKQSIVIQATQADSYAVLTGTGTVTLKDGMNSFTVYATSEFGTKGKVYTINVERQQANTANKLSDLEVMVGGSDVLIGDQAFNADKKLYQIRVNNTVTSLVINASVDPLDRSTVTGAGSKTLQLGANTFTIKVTAENGIENTYTVEVMRANDTNDIENIEVSSFESVIFDKETLTYALGNVPSSLKTLQFNVTLLDSSAKLYFNGVLQTSPYTYTLKSGLNTITVHAVSEFGTKGVTYTYTVTQDIAKKDASLSDLDVMAGTTNLLDTTFDPAVLSYTMRVDRSVSQVIINPTLKTGQQQTLSGDTGSQPLSAGVNTFRVTVTAEDGVTKQTYLIEVTRKNDNNVIQNITVDGQSISFEEDTTTYTLSTVLFTKTSIEIQVVKADSYAVVTGAGTVTLKDGMNTYTVYATSEFGTKGKVYTINVFRQQANTVNKLSDLEVMVGGSDVLTGDQAFDANKNLYQIRVNNTVTSLIINASVDPLDRSTVTGAGSKTIQLGLNTFNVKVTAEDGTENIYVIEITRANDNNEIDMIEITSFESIIYNKTTYSYALGSVPFSMKSLQMTLTLADSSAKLYINGGLQTSPYTYTLKAGLNTISVYAVSEYGTKGATYTFTVTQEAAKTNANLESLSVMVGAYNLLEGIFSPSVLSYTMRVDRNISQIQINPILKTGQQQTLSGDTGNQPLSVGVNTFRVTVTAEDGITKQTYLIEVIKKNDNSVIQDITVDGQSISFVPGTTTYTLPSVTFAKQSIDIQATASDTYATVTGNGIKTLKDGMNTYTVYATSEFGTKGTTYTINVERKVANTENKLSDLEVMVGGSDVLTGDQAFDSNKNLYQIRVNNTFTSITINASVNPLDRSTVTGAGSKTIQLGLNSFNVKVTAEDGTENIYVIEITRANDNNEIENIQVGSFEGILFNKMTYSYALGNVPFSTKTLSFVIETLDSSSKLYINGGLQTSPYTYTLKSGSNTVSIYAVSEFGTKGATYTYTVTQNAAKTDANLESLQVMAGTTNLLSESFDPAVLSYTMRVDRSVAQVLINATLKTGQQQTLSGDTGNQPLSVGVNTFRVTVTAEDGVTKQTYLIEVTRKNDNNIIQNITVDGQSISFEEGITTYTLAPVLYTKQSIDVQATASDSYAVVTGNGIKTLKDGINTYTVYATSEFGTKGITYTINIERQQANTLNKLTDLEVMVDGSDVLTGDQAFDPNKNLYQIRVNNTVSSLVINASVNPLDRSTVTGTGTKNLSQPTHSFKVTVTSENGILNDYVIEVTRKNNNFNISNIAATGYSGVVFNANSYSYDLGHVPYTVKNVNFNVTLEDSSATLLINGVIANLNTTHILKSGLNTFEIKARSEFGEESKVYTYTIYQDEANDIAELNVLEAIVGTNNLLSGIFSKDDLMYEIRVDRNISQIKINASADPMIYATVSGNRGTFPLAYGLNTFSINVVAEDGITSQTYTIKVLRANDNNEITNIMVNGVQVPGFDPEVTTYELPDYTFDIKTVNLTATLADSYATLKGTGVITLVDGKLEVKVYATSEAGTKGTEYTIILNRIAAFTDASLQNLVVSSSGVPLSFEEGLFTKSRTGYTIKLDPSSTITSVDILAELMDARQSISGNTGSQTLTVNQGVINQTFTITVTAENGAQKTYSITILKGSNLSSDASINRVTLTDLAGNQYLTFNPLLQVQQEIVLDYQTSVISLNVVPNNQNAIVVGGGTFTINPNQTVTLKFQVIAQDGVTTSINYEVKVRRQVASDDNLLSSLKVSVNGTDLLIDHNAFNPTKYTYTLKVNRSVTLIDIKAIANHVGAKVSGDINQVTLVPGLQQLRVFVTAESGAQRTYYVNIEVVNSDVELISLSVDHFIINYDKDTYSYDLGEISSNFTSLNIKALISSLSYGTLSGDLGVVELKYGLNVFNIIATSEDQSMVETYQIFATRLEPSANNYLLDLYVTDGTYILPFDNAVFNKETGFYQIILDKTSKVSSIEIFATAENGTTPKGTGQFLLTAIAGVIKNDFYVTVTAANGEVRSYQIQVIKSDSSHLNKDNSIKTIEISTANGTYGVNFNPENVVQEPIILDYKDSSFFVDITAAQGATIVGRDLYKLNAGETKKIYFQVTAENGEVGLKYELEVTRSLPDSNNVATSLKVIIDGETIELDVSKNEHFLDIPNTIATIGIDAEITDTQTITGLGNKTISLNVHKFYVVITAQDGTPNVYMIQTTRRSNDSTLKSIKLDGVEVFGQFIAGKLSLPDVLYEVNQLDILATATSSKAIVSGNGLKNLEVGLNTFEIYATSELGEVGDVYVVEITRLSPSSDATLKSIVIKNNSTGTPIEFLPTFNPTTTKYTVSLSLADQVSEILIEATASSINVKSVDGLGVYTLKAASSQTTEIFTITVQAEDKTVKTYEIHVTRDVEPEDDITIDHLSLFGGTINYVGTTQDAIQSFTASTYEYNILVPYQLGSVNLSITNLNGASIIGAGNHVLNPGTTVIEFYLVSKSGYVRSEDYTITITKQQASTDNTLKSLSIDQKLIQGFSPTVLSYQLQVTLEDVSKVNISAIANHPYATVIGDLGEVDLIAGTNTINIRVIAEDLSVKTYQIVISRLSGDHTLKDIYVLGQTLNYPFSQDRIRYEVTVPYTTEYVEIGAVAHEKANVINTGIKYLEVGDNVYEVYAFAENGVKGKTYEVHVIREEVSNDSSLKSLVIRDAVTNNVIGFAPEFRPSTLEYVIVLDKESPIASLIINGIANDIFASVGGNGYKVLKAKVDGDYHNVFEVTVRAQDQSTTTYTISVYKDVNLSDSTTISSLSLIGSDGITYIATTGGNITFSPNQYLYEMSVPYHLTSMTLDIRSDSATPYGIGTKTFDTNEMVFEAYLVSQSGINQTDDYVIRITREDAVVENTLANMIINGKSIEGFDPDKTYYELNIPYLSVSSVMLNASPLDPTARVSGDIGTHTLREGKNVYTINVTAQNGDLKTYTVVVNYNNVNAFLDDLKVINPNTEVSYPFTFNPNTFTYRVNVGKNDEEVLITGRAQDQSYAAIVGLGRYQVNEYGTTAMINVIASDNSTILTYTIEIIREEKASNNTRLKSMSISGQNVTFNPDTQTYVLSVNNGINALDVNAEAESSVATVSIRGAEDIVQGRNVIMIEVTAEDGTIGYYTVVVNKDAAPNNFLTMLLIISLLVWIITVLIFLIRASRDKKYFKKNLIR